VQIVVAIAFMSSGESALGLALSVASLINGPIVGVFLVGTFLRRAREIHALAGMAASIVLMLYILLGTKIAWTWYALIGSLTTLGVAFLASVLLPNKNEELS
jgi:Na+/proline symporter